MVMENPHPPSLGLHELTELAKRFVEAKRYEEALQLFEMALRLDPRNMGVQLGLAQVRRLYKATGGRGSPGDSLREGLRRKALDAKHFVGLAHLYAERNDEERALEYLEIAIARDLPNPAPHKLFGRLLFKRREFVRAVTQLTKAWRFNPFDREVSRLLGRCRYELADFQGALAAFVDAFLLLPQGHRREAHEIKERIQQLKERLGWGNEPLARLFHQRQEELRVAFDRLEWHRDRHREARPTSDTQPVRAVRGPGRIEVAARLRQLEPWGHLSDEEVFALTEATSEEQRERGETVFAHDSEGTDFFLLEQGEITIQRPTPYGVFPLGLIKPGDLFGEVNFITRARRSGDAVASLPSRLIRLDAGRLEELIGQRPQLGVQLYWTLWHNLAFKLRCTNEQLKTFFSDRATDESALHLRRQQLAESQRVAVDSTIKMRLFEEKGLTTKELMALAAFSRELSFAGGSHIFQEGDPGREMYVVLEGKVRISKQIPGAGEEALAILERGDFFGEMALIDGQPRSADARAHGGAATVIALEETTIRDVLGAEPATALELLQLLCRLIAERLREIDEKVTGWRIMTGGPSQKASAS
jgi:CRP/FNR family transcriptional regulator, cyclic AMP receptor protein